MYQVQLLVALFLGTRSFTTLHDFLVALTTTPEGHVFLLLGNAIEALLSIALLSMTFVSFPLLLDRDVDFVTAMITSVRKGTGGLGKATGGSRGERPRSRQKTGSCSGCTPHRRHKVRRRYQGRGGRSVLSAPPFPAGRSRSQVAPCSTGTVLPGQSKVHGGDHVTFVTPNSYKAFGGRQCVRDA